jgi:hypothetical protein
MTVGAADFAFGDLRKDGFPDEAAPSHGRDVTPFVAKVVELQNDRIALAAISARVGRQVLPHSKLVLFRADSSHLLHVSEMLVPVSQIPEALVLDVAGLAPRLTNASLAILEAELIDGFFDAASSASSRGRLHRTGILSHSSGRNNHIDTEIQTATRDSSVRETTTTRVCDTRMFGDSVLQSPDPAFLFF